MRASALARPEQTRFPFIFSKSLDVAAAAQPAPAIDRASNHGCTLRRAFDCEYMPSVRASDLLHIDFDVREVRAPGLFLVEILDVHMSHVEWHGVRQFDMAPNGLVMDQAGNGEWIPADLTKWRMRIVGRVTYIYRVTPDGTEVHLPCRSVADDARSLAEGVQPDKAKLAQRAVSAALAAAHGCSADASARGAASLLGSQVSGTGGAVLRILRELSIYDLSFVFARALPAGLAHCDCVQRNDARERALDFIELVAVADALHAIDLGRILVRRLTCRHFGEPCSVADTSHLCGMSETTVRRRARAIAEVLGPIEREIWARLVPRLRDVGALDPAWQLSHRWNLERRGPHAGA